MHDTPTGSQASSHPVPVTDWALTGSVDEAPAVAPLPAAAGAAPFVVLVSGSRHATAERHASIVATVLDQYYGHYRRPVVLRHGGAPGIDTIAADRAHQWLWSTDPHPADWANCGPDCPPRPHRKLGLYGPYCPLAGPRRNQAMVDALPRPGVVLAVGQK